MNDARLATFEWCQMDMRDFIFFILMNRIEKQVLQNYSQGAVGNLASISILALFLVLKQLKTRDQRRGVNGHQLGIPVIWIMTVTTTVV